MDADTFIQKHILSVKQTERECIVRASQRDTTWTQARYARCTLSELAANIGLLKRFAKTSESQATRMAKQTIAYANELGIFHYKDKPVIMEHQQITPAMQHGIDHEKDGLKYYTEHMQKQMWKCAKDPSSFRIEERGLFIDPRYPWLAGSVDALAYVDDQLTKVIEIKCPMPDPDNPWKLRNKLKYAPRRGHSWYIQCQGYMFFYDTWATDLVVWSEKQTTIFNIAFDPEYWYHTLLPQAEQFYFNTFIPTLRSLWDKYSA